MPWCDNCARWYSPNALEDDGSCPSCGLVVEEPSEPGAEAEPPPRPPWHFWLLVGSAAVYLGWRLIQGVIWVIDRL
jgi:hypothetical protein